MDSLAVSFAAPLSTALPFQSHPERAGTGHFVRIREKREGGQAPAFGFSAFLLEWRRLTCFSIETEGGDDSTLLAFCFLHCPAQSLAHFAFFSVFPCLPTVPCVPVPALASACCQWHPVLCTLKSRIEENTGHTFNSLLCNLYRDEKDSVDWHSDDEPSLGSCPVIASLSFGATRTFEMRKKPPPVSILCLKHTFSSLTS